MHVLNQIKKAKKVLFTGIEAEGIYKGLLTLFVKGRVKKSEIQKLLDSSKRYSQVYFGAGDLSEYNLRTVLDIAVGNLAVLVTVETQKKIPWEMLGNMSIMLTINNLNFDVIDWYSKNWPRNKVQLKIITKEQIFCCLLSNMSFNSYQDYKGDIIDEVFNNS